MLDFLGIGAQKAGSSWLHKALAAHPSLHFPAGKEVHFWNARRELGLQWYQSLFAQAPAGARCGEITPAYAILDEAIVREIRELNPSLRVLYVVRNPVERAWSSARMALERAEMRLEEASDQWFIDHFRSRGSLARGDYEACLRTWHAVFGREPVLVLRYEQIGADPCAFAQACARHLGVDAGFYELTPPPGLQQRVFASPPEPIRGSLLPVLQELYRPKIASLAAYLETDLGAWLGDRAA